MIAEALILFFTAVVEFIIGLIPTTAPPAWVNDAAGALSTVWAYAAGLGAWIPWSVVAPVFASVMACVALGLVIKLVRIVASFFTAGGGSAA